MTSEWTHSSGSDSTCLCGHVVSAPVHLSAGWVFTLFFSKHHPNRLCWNAIYFSSHCAQECKAGRKKAKQWFPWQQSENPPRLRALSFFLFLCYLLPLQEQGPSGVLTEHTVYYFSYTVRPVLHVMFCFRSFERSACHWGTSFEDIISSDVYPHFTC